jgi:hypothetical protein
MSVEWLINNAGSVVKYRTHTELLKTNDSGLLQKIMADILAMPQTQKRLDLLRNLDYNNTHGSPGTYLENVLPMLNDYGLYYDMDAFKRETKGIIDISKTVVDDSYDKLIAYPFLLRSKFPIDGLLDYAVERINTIYDFTKHMNFDIYDDVANYKSVPKSFQDRPVIKPEIASGSSIRLPMIYDIVSMEAIYNCVSVEIQEKVDNIIEYIISPEYDVVEPMYGILCAAPRKYYAMGWDCKKPFNDNQSYSNSNLHRLLLYSTFPVVFRNAWFQNALDYLTQFKTPNGTYSFPKDYLPEADGNWVLGVRMSLAENRRKKQWAEVESTFYMLKLLNSLK